MVPPAAPLSRDQIIETARNTISRHGVDHLSLRGIARDLGVTAPALYAYVADKQDLIAAVAADYFDELIARFDSIDEPDPFARLRALSRAYVDHAVAEPELFHLLFRYPPGGTGLSVPGVDPFAPATRAFAAALSTTADAIDSGLLAVDDPVAAAMTMWAAIHGVCEVLLMGFGFDETTRDALVESVISTVLSGQVHGF